MNVLGWIVVAAFMFMTAVLVALVWIFEKMMLDRACDYYASYLEELRARGFEIVLVRDLKKHERSDRD